MTGLAFLLPWDRLPARASVLVPLAYLGSALALTLAAGTTSGVGIVVLIPLVWTALFHRRWESACLVAAVVAGEVVVSLVQSVPDAVIGRRVLLWGVLGALLAVATHGLRDRITRSQQVTERLQERIGELMVIQDRDRLAADLQGSVVQRIFAAGLKLQGALPLAGHPELRQRITSCVDDLDDAVRLLRHAIFGLENREGINGLRHTNGLRHEVLQLCIGASPVPEIAFTGPVDEILSPGVGGRLLDLLGLALGSIGTHSEQTSVLVEAGESLSVIVPEPEPEPAMNCPPGLPPSPPAILPRCESGPGRTTSRWRSRRRRRESGWRGVFRSELSTRRRTKVPRPAGERPSPVGTSPGQAGPRARDFLPGAGPRRCRADEDDR